MLPRRVQAEQLDGLAANDPVAARSRRDLQRVHRVMGTRARLVRMFRQLAPRKALTPLRVLELGAGDGSLLLGVAQELDDEWSAVELTLLDRVALVEGRTVAEYAHHGWTARSRVADVLDWAREVDRSPPGARTRWDLIVANLFLHHFEDRELALVLRAIAASTDELIACEPRRGWRALAGSHLVAVLGANAVTRTDAVLSVHAGFRAHELTSLWPGTAEWTLEEAASGALSHCFRATRRRTP
jgi:hypothetical protein